MTGLFKLLNDILFWKETIRISTSIAIIKKHMILKEGIQLNNIVILS